MSAVNHTRDLHTDARVARQTLAVLLGRSIRHVRRAAGGPECNRLLAATATRQCLVGVLTTLALLA